MGYTLVLELYFLLIYILGKRERKVAVPLFGVWAIDHKKSTGMLVFGIIGIVYGLYISFRIVLLINLYFGKKGEEAIISAYFGVLQHKSKISLSAAITYTVVFTIAVIHLTLSLVVSVLSIKYYHHCKPELPSERLILRASNEEVDEAAKDPVHL
ncbi:unnamed protein product [Strongylus vulgaris]|uniref:Uncharacterized protein n=1 Tax=Strongylus vulgaris TaxID=40348 RepID=A0A3P7JD18_STRVU|nr:unnamed protein product [Strongylus vulgaris]